MLSIRSVVGKSIWKAIVKYSQAVFDDLGACDVRGLVAISDMEEWAAGWGYDYPQRGSECAEGHSGRGTPLPVATTTSKCFFAHSSA